MRHEHLPAVAFLEMEGDEGGLWPGGMYRHEVPGPDPAKQVSEPVFGNLEVLRDIHAASLAGAASGSRLERGYLTPQPQ